MILNVTIDDQTLPIEVSESFIQEAEAFYRKMDEDMSKGWQMSRRWVEHPNVLQRCQIAADKLLGAIHRENKDLVMLSCGYILSRLPEAKEVIIDTTGDMNETEFLS